MELIREVVVHVVAKRGWVERRCGSGVTRVVHTHIYIPTLAPFGGESRPGLKRFRV